MENKKTAVFGLCSGPAAAEKVVAALVNAGFSNNSISVLLADNQSTKLRPRETHESTRGTAAGVATGGVLGGTLGLLAGIGALAIPGVGPFIAAGPIMGALAGLGVGGAVGGLIGALVGMGIPEYEAKRYEGRLKAGGVLLSVHCDTADQITRAKAILTGTAWSTSPPLEKPGGIERPRYREVLGRRRSHGGDQPPPFRRQIQGRDQMTAPRRSGPLTGRMAAAKRYHMEPVLSSSVAPRRLCGAFGEDFGPSVRNEAHASGMSDNVIGGAFVAAALSLILLALGTVGSGPRCRWSNVGASASTIPMAAISG
jgi:hypothetical protein